MDLARYVVDAVVLEGRSYRDVASAHGVSKSWVGKIVTRFRQGGYEAIVPRPRVAHRIPHRTPASVEDEVVAMRKRLLEEGFDAGAETIRYHLQKSGQPGPSVTTIWRILRRRGCVTPQPHKRPKSSWVRFEASLPNECWQSDATGWRLADGTGVEIVNFIDDYSRLAICSKAVSTATVSLVIKGFREAAAQYGFPAALLTDNGCIYTTWHRGGANAFQTELVSLGIDLKHSRPYHPQTCGKVERFHQTMKSYLSRQPRAKTVKELQAQLDRFIAYYNDVRPHRARERQTPRSAFDGRDKARPSGPKLKVPSGVRVRQDRIDGDGRVTLRYRGTLHHIAVGRQHKRKRVKMLIDRLDIRILSSDGELLRRLTLDPNKRYQPLGTAAESSKDESVA